MSRADKIPKEVVDKGSNINLLEQVTPLARQINCLDINRIADVCISSIPALVRANFASLYILDESSNILHLYKHNHPFLINKIVSLNQNPTPLMVMAVKSKDLILVPDIDSHKKPVIKKSQRVFAENYRTKNYNPCLPCWGCLNKYQNF